MIVQLNAPKPSKRKMSKSLVWIYEKSAQSMLCWTLLFCCIVNEEIKEKQTCPAVLFKAQLKPGWSFDFLCLDHGCSFSSSIHFLNNSLAPSVGQRKIMQLQIYVRPFFPGGGSSCEWSSGFTYNPQFEEWVGEPHHADIIVNDTVPKLKNL